MKKKVTRSRKRKRKMTDIHFITFYINENQIMGKARRRRIYFNKNRCLPPANNEKIVLTSEQLGNLITRVRINQMEEDGYCVFENQERI